MAVEGPSTRLSSGLGCGQLSCSVEEPPAFLGAAIAGQLVAGIFNGKLVVVSELFTTVDLAHGKDDNVLLPVDVDDSGVAVGLTGVVDEARCVPMHGGVHDLRVVNTEHVTANALGDRERGWR